MRTHLGLLASLLSIVSSARGASGVGFHDAVDVFDLPFAPSGARVCRVNSEGRAPASDCEGVRTDRIVSDLDVGQEAVIVRRAENAYVLTYSLAGPHSGWFRGVETLAAKSHPGARIENKYSDDLTKVHIGYAEVRRRDLVIHEPGARRELVELVSYHIPGARGDHILTVEAPPSIAELARADVDRALPALTVQVSPYAKLWVKFVRVLPWIVAFLAILVASSVGAFVYLRRQRSPAG